MSDDLDVVVDVTHWFPGNLSELATCEVVTEFPTVLPNNPPLSIEALHDAAVSLGMPCSYCKGEGRTWRTTLGRPPYKGHCDYCNGTGKAPRGGRIEK